MRGSTKATNSRLSVFNGYVKDASMWDKNSCWNQTNKNTAHFFPQINQRRSLGGPARHSDALNSYLMLYIYKDKNEINSETKTCQCRVL